MANYTVGDDYTSSAIQTAIDLIPGNLSGHGKEWVQVYAKAAGYAEPAINIVDGFSNASDGVDYVDVEAMVSHNGLKNSGIVVDCDHGAGWQTIGMGDYSRLHGFCLTWTGTGRVGSNFLFRNNTQPTKEVYVYDNIIYDIQGNAADDTDVFWWTTGYWKIYNNQIFNIGNVTGAGVAMYMGGNGASGHEILISDNAIYNVASQLRGDNKDYYLVHNNFAKFYGLTGAHNVITYNISSDATADDWGGTGNLINKAAADQFVSVTAGSEDFHLKPTADCFRNGADMSAYFTHDCVNIPRKFWRTGAFETLPKVYSVNDGKPHSVYYSWGGNAAKVDGVDVPLRNTETMTSNDEATIQVGQYSTGNQFGGLIGDLRVYDSPDVKVTR